MITIRIIIRLSGFFRNLLSIADLITDVYMLKRPIVLFLSLQSYQPYTVHY